MRQVRFPPFGFVLAEFGLPELGLPPFWAFFGFRKNPLWFCTAVMFCVIIVLVVKSVVNNIVSDVHPKLCDPIFVNLVQTLAHIWQEK